MFHKFEVIALGDYSLDLIFTGLPRLPELGQEVISTGFEMIPGAAYNSVVAMHRLGIKVGWASDFGNDDFSRFALERARFEGLDESLFVHHKQPMRRISVAASFPEDRAFITYNDPEPGVPAAIKALMTASAKVLYVPGMYYGELFDLGLRLLRAKHMKLVMDGNNVMEATLQDPAVCKAVQSSDMFLPNSLEAYRLTGEEDLERAILRLGELSPLVVVKDGACGAYALKDGNFIHVPGIKIEPLDTTGAGDCFNAGFLKAWLDGLPLEECLRWGNVVGGLSTLARGGTGRCVTARDVQDWLNKGIQYGSGPGRPG